MTTHSDILAGEFHGQRSLAGYSTWGRKELDTTEQITFALFHFKTGNQPLKPGLANTIIPGWCPRILLAISAPLLCWLSCWLFSVASPMIILSKTSSSYWVAQSGSWTCLGVCIPLSLEPTADGAGQWKANFLISGQESSEVKLPSTHCLKSQLTLLFSYIAFSTSFQLLLGVLP